MARLDFRLAKAYEAGVALAETVIVGFLACQHGVPTTPHVPATNMSPLQPASKIEELSPAPSRSYSDVAALLAEGRARSIASKLLDLKSDFQPFAADAAATTLLDWSKWATSANLATAANTPGQVHQVGDLLYAQGQLWRVLLSGEKRATDVLSVGDYVGALQHLISTYARMATHVVRSTAGLLVTALLLIALAAVGYALYRQQTQTLIGALVSAGGLLGISGAGATAAVKRALGQAEQHLWLSEQAYAVATAISKVPAAVPDSSVEKLRNPGRVTPKAAAALDPRQVVSRTSRL